MKELQNLFKIATSEMHLVSNNAIFDQIGGVSMGPPLAPILSNIFMGYHKRDWIEKALVVKPAFCMTILTIDMLTIFLWSLNLN